MNECLRYRAHKYGAKLICSTAQGWLYTIYFLGDDFLEHQSLNSACL